MAPLEVYKPFTPPCTLPSSPTSSCDTSSSSSDDDSSVAVAPRTRCMYPGRRLIGGRIYDSVLGVTCHWCRQKTVEDHVFCCQCTIAFCGGCLRNRHGEDIEVEMRDDVHWTCPKCRGGCGPGCKNCCNCGPCRKAQGLEPTGLLVHTARTRGFSNVHDYLIYQKTGECEKIIERRKRGKGWCQTDPSSFRKKQKRTETDDGVEASCRKRLNFTPSQSQEKKHNKPLCTSALQWKEVSPTANIKKDGVSHSVKVLKSKEEASSSAIKENAQKAFKSQEHEKVSSSASKETAKLQPKPVPDKHVQDDLGSKVAMASEKATLVQPKPEPEFHAHDESRNKVAASLPGEVTDARLLGPDVDASQGGSLPPPQHVVPPSNAIPNSYECNLNHKVVPKKEQCDLDLECNNGASNILLKVKTEEVPLHHETSVSKSALQEGIDQPVEKRHENVFQLKQVKEEIHERGSQPVCEGVNPLANFWGDKSNTPLSTFSLDFAVPSHNVELLSSTSTPTPKPTWLNGETCRDGNVTSPSPLNFHLSPGSSNFHLYPGHSNFHLYPGSSAPTPLNVKEVSDGQNLKTPECRVKLESISSQEAQCNFDPCPNMPMKEEVSVSSHAKFDNCFTLAPVKEEREEIWNVHSSARTIESTKNASQTSSIFNTVKVKAEREEVSFTIEPVLRCPSKDGSFEVKREVNVGASMSKLICVDDEVQTLPTISKPETSGLEKSSPGSFGDVSHLWKVDDFRKKLEARLSEPFNRKELEMLTAAASHRKPIYKARETRQGCSQFVSEEEGYSYLDHHPDLARKLEECDCPFSRLSLLRGLFFWLEYASMLGAFKPWTSALGSSDAQENDDCIEIDGPDCEILAVVCSVD